MAEAKFQALMRRLVLPAALLLGVAAAWAEAYDWTALSAAQQSMLAPWQREWASFPPERRRLLANLAARHPADAPQYGQLKAEIAYYAALLEHERARLLARYKDFKNLPPDKQQEIMRQWLQYDSLPAEEKEAWRRLAQQRK